MTDPLTALRNVPVDRSVADAAAPSHPSSASTS